MPFKKNKKKQYIGLNILEEDKKQKQFNYGEIFRQIRSNIEFSNVDNPIHSIVITSTQADEAKTTVAVNLAYVFAAKYKKVLLIDCDLRKRQLAHYMDLSNHFGLSNVMFDYQKNKTINHDYFLTVENETFEGSLTVLPAGQKVPNPSEILGSNLFKTLLNELKEEYDFVIVDCPPVGSTTDAIPVGNNVDGALYIVSSRDTNKKAALEGINLLQRNNVNVLGTVLTKAEADDHHGYYYYY